MKLMPSALLVTLLNVKVLDPFKLYGRKLAKWWGLGLTLMLLASCSSLGKPERQQSPVAPACSQRTPALDSGDPPSGADVTDWMAWAKAYVVAQYAVVDRDNKRAATADCLDRLTEIKP